MFADRIGLDGKFMSETSDAPLLELPDELLACVLRDVDALIAVACVCKQLSTVLANNDSLWVMAADAVAPCSPLSARATMLTLRRVGMILKPFVVQPPLLSVPQRVRCAANRTSAGTTMMQHGVEPLNFREREWLRWYGRMRNGTMHLSFEGSGRVALHLHDACTDKCIACVLQEGVAHGNQRAATPTAAMPLTLASGEEQLAEAVREFRHRVGLVSRISVVDGTKDSARRALLLLGGLPRCVCRKLDALTIEGCPDSALTSLIEWCGEDCPAGEVAGNRRMADGMPAVVIAEQARLRLSIGHAMCVVGSLVRQLVRLDNDVATNRGCENAPRRTVQHVVLVAAGQKAAETLEKAVRSISFKSHQALLPASSEVPTVA